MIVCFIFEKFNFIYAWIILEPIWKKTVWGSLASMQTVHSEEGANLVFFVVFKFYQLFNLWLFSFISDSSGDQN